jgi:hypothetical protein
MTDKPPILSYATARSAFEDLSCTYRAELKPAAIWSQIVILAVGIFVLVITLGSFLAGALRTWPRVYNDRGWSFLLFLIVVMFALGFAALHLLRELLRLRAFGGRVISIAIHDGSLLIDHPAAWRRSPKEWKCSEIEWIDISHWRLILRWKALYLLRISPKRGREVVIRFLGVRNSTVNEFYAALLKNLQFPRPNAPANLDADAQPDPHQARLP